MPELVKKQAEVGKIEHAEMVHHDDTHWRDEPKTNVGLRQMDEGKKKLVASQLKIGDVVKEETVNRIANCKLLHLMTKTLERLKLCSMH